MIRSGALLALLLGLGACQQSDAASGNASVGADQSCDNLSPHAAESDCRLRVAAESRTQMLKALDANRKHARAYDALPINRGYQNFFKNLETSQAEWEKYSKVQCEFESGKNSGSGGWDLLAKCQNRLNQQRLTELKNALAWDAERGDIETGK